MFKPPNLDKCTYQELTEAKQVFQMYTLYCYYKKIAVGERDDGKIARAIHWEKKCERIYLKLPQWARW